MKLPKIFWHTIYPPTRKQIAITGLTLAVVLGVTLGLVLTGGGPPTSTVRNAAAPSTAPTTTTSTLPYLGAYRCPLTDLPAPAGAPLRPALAVKVGNEPQGARPQSGLNEADIVYDTPAEGFIMRYIMVFQCNSASQVGPDRSVRWVDRNIVRQFVSPILSFAGGINPNVDKVMASAWIHPANLLQAAASAGIRTTNRSAPDNLYTNTTALWKMYTNDQTPPRPVFLYTPSLPASAQPAASLAINFSFDTDVVWKWDPSINGWLHTYSGQTDVDELSNQPVSATNVVVQVVHYKFGKYAESRGGSGDFQSQTLGTGVGYVLRNGRSIKVTWHRKDLLAPTTYTDASGQQVGLAAGRTWVELVPDSTAAAPGQLAITP